MSTATTNQPTERDLVISLHPHASRVDYRGTAAQLQSDGLIPGAFEWPRTSAKKVWCVNGLEYQLQRARPYGHKGSWIELDSWSLIIMAGDRDWYSFERRDIERKAEELRVKAYRLTPEGDREWRAFMARCWAASQDKAFQDFKALFVPERKKQGRKVAERPTVR